MKKLARIRCSQSEDICVWLHEVHGAPYVKLRVYRRSGRAGGDSLTGIERVAVPVDVLPALVRVLGQALERIVQDGLVQVASLPEETTMQAGEPVARSTTPHRRYSRRESRDHRRLRVTCRFLHAAESSSPKAVTGETMDVSNGGAQVWLPERFSPSRQVEVSMRIGGLDFQGQAEVVDVQTHPTRGGYQLSLRWIGLTAREKAALSKAILDSGFVGLGALDRRERRQM